MAACQKVDKDYYSNGKLKQEIPYKKGKMDGVAKWYYENGQLQQSSAYVQGRLEGLTTRWYEHGLKQSEGMYSDNMRNGIQTDWGRTGKKVKEETFKKDTLNGVSRVFHANQAIKIEGNYLDGKFDGRWIYWDESGNVTGEGIFTEGNGTMRTWNSWGVLMFVTEYRNNMKNGKEIAYNEKGEIIREMIYVDDEMIEANFFDGSLTR